MDLLGHVNNVRYLDYLTEARVALLLEQGVDPAAVRLTGHRIEFVAPMVFGREPAQVRAWLVEDHPDATSVRVAQEVTTPGGQVHLRTESHLQLAEEAAGILGDVARAPGHTWRPVHVDLHDSASSPTPGPGAGTAPGAPAGAGRRVRHRYPVTLRERDLGRDGTARDDAVLELFQESRIRYFMDLHTRGEQWSQHVVARTDLALLGDVRPGPSLEIRSWIARVGGSSFVVRGDLCARASGEVVARTLVVMVGFDPETGSPAEMSDQQRARLTRELG